MPPSKSTKKKSSRSRSRSKSRSKPYPSPYYKPSVCCSKIFIKPLFQNVKKGEYLEPIRQWIKYFDDDYHKKILKQNRKTDEVMMRYVQCRPFMRAVLSTETPSRKVNVVHKQPLNGWSKKQTETLLFELMSVRELDCDYKVKSSKPPPLTVYFYELNRDIVLTPEDFPGAVYSTDNFLETILTAKSTLHKENLFHLEYMDVERFKTFNSSIKKMNQYLLTLYKNYSQLDLETIYHYSGIIPLSLGMRNISDIDAHILSSTNDDKRKKGSNGLESEIPKLLRFDIDLVPIRNIKAGYKYLFQTLIKKVIHDDDLDSAFYHPKMYYYFYGLKISDLRFFHTLRYFRNRPKAIAGLVYFHDQLQIKLPIPDIPTDKLPAGRTYLTYPMIDILLKTGDLEKSELKNLQSFEESDFLRLVDKYLNMLFDLNLSRSKIKEIIQKAPKDPYDFPVELE